MKDAKEVFASRFFDWAIDQASREIDEDFPNLRAIEAPAVFQFLEFCDADPNRAGADLLSALVRAAHGYALALRGESLTETELQLLRKYQGTEQFKGVPGYVTGFFSKGFTENMQNKFARNIEDALPEAIISDIAARFEGHATRERSGVLRVAQKIGPWHVTTHFNCGLSRPTRLSYAHRISRFPYGEGTVLDDLGPSERPAHGISMLGWLGIFPTTAWMSIPGGTADETGAKVSGIAQILLSSLPVLLSGIEVP